MRRLLILIISVVFATGCGRQLEKSTTLSKVPAALPQIVRLDSRFDQIVPKDAALEKVAEGFMWAEGPVWNRAGGFLLFSDVPNNAIIKWKAGEGTGVFLKPSGYTGTEPFTGREPGSNPHLKASFERRKNKGWMTEITTWKRVPDTTP